MEESKESIKAPLIESRPVRKRTYFKTNIFDTYFLLWVDKIVDIGRRKPFQQDMHWDLREKETSEHIVVQLSTAFQQLKHKKNPLFKALAKTTKGIFFRALFCTLICGLLQYSAPLLIKYIINYITQPDKDIKMGILLVLGVIFSRILISLFSARSEILITLLGINTSNAINGLVYEKALKFSLVRSADHSFGSLTNHIEVDSEKLYYLGTATGGVFTLPILILVGIYFMYAAVGISFLAGIGVIVLMGVVNFLIGKIFFKYQKLVMEKKDKRMKITTEIMNGIKYIKMSGWEEAFLDKIYKAREKELSSLKKQYMATSVSVFTLWLTPMLITTAIFGTYVFTGNEMNAKTAFTLVSTLTILQEPIRSLSSMIALTLECKVAIDRVTKFLLAEELNTDYIKKKDPNQTDIAIKMKKGNFYWLSEEEKKLKTQKEREEQEKEKKEKKKKKSKKSKVAEESTQQESSQNESIIISSQNQPLLSLQEQDSVLASPEKAEYRLVLKDINLEIKKGTFVAILGDVGSGKSSFLFSLIGEMKYNPEDPPEAEVNGSVSYISQQAWILNSSVKNNIIFGKEFSEPKYQEAIKYSCLNQDLEILNNKDETEIGEKGINLSGGQKARISLARALYRESDIYLLDDPLSAVDAHVGKFILNECFMSYLKDKTRVLVTHKFESLKYVDYIYIFKQGKIIEEGTFLNLKDSPTFKEVEKKYKMMSQTQEEEEEERKSDEQEEIDKLIIKEEKEEKGQSDILNIQTKKILTTEEQNASVLDKAGNLPPTEEDKMLEEKLMLDEDREIGVVGWGVWKSYFNYYGGFCFFALVFLVMLTWISVQTSANFLLSYWSDHAEDSKYSKSFYFEMYSVLGLSYAFFCLIRVAMLFLQSIRCSRILHKDMVSKIIRAPINLFFDRVPIGRLLNRFSKDLTVLDNYIAASFGSTLVNFYSFLADIFVCLVVGTVWVFPLVVIFVFISYKIQSKYMVVNREIVRLESISKSPIVSFLSESLNGLTSIRAYQEEKKFSAKFHTLQNENIKNLIVTSGLSNWFTLRVTLWSVLIIAPSVAVPVNDKIDWNLILKAFAGTAGLLITYVVQISDDIIYLLWMLSSFEAKLISLERCRAFTRVEGEAEPNTLNLPAVENFSPDWPSTGTIEFQNYYVKYRPNLPYVLKNLNFHINNGEKIGVVGRTGSGKSTLLLCLMRIIESDQGRILIDGVDISKIGLDDLRRKITIVPQDPMLFRGTLRDNLDLFKKYTDEQLWESLERVCMKTKFEEENGLDTEIKEGGENLSAGEKQLLCIGRAILTQCKIILIDEATSNIDPKTEQVILDTLHNSFKDCTVITIAHRLKTVINSDRILMMAGGELLEFDAPQTLINDETTHFHKLWMEYEHAHKDHQ